MSEKPQQ
jgi:chromosome segregation ATPase